MDEVTVKYEATRFLDAMVPRTKVTYDDLVAHISDMLGITKNKTQVLYWVQEVVRVRPDFTVYKGRGICKAPQRFNI